MIYQIRDWDTHFENNKSRERDRCSFVCVPNKQHGLGFCRIMAEPDGAAIYGIWHMITGACSQQSKPRLGWLTDTGRAPDGQCPGSAWAVSDLALKFRRPVEEVQRALDVLSSKSVGWIVCHSQVPDECPPSARVVPVQCPGMERREEKRTERTEGSVCDFELFWKAYPKKVSRFDAEHAFSEVQAKHHIKEILSAVESQSKSKEWKKDGGKFIPNPAKWLRDGRWQDHIEKSNGVNRDVFRLAGREWKRDSAGPALSDFEGNGSSSPEGDLAAFRPAWEKWLEETA